MNRRSPVRSVLAQRKMFANGGMLPISTPMQNTMDQGQNKASGILASSTPLIEAVSQEILAPMTGGAMPVAGFHEGGYAHRHPHGLTIFGEPPKLQEGDAEGKRIYDAAYKSETPIGLQTSGPFAEVEYKPTVGERAEIGLGSPPEDLQKRANMTAAERLESIFPYEAELTGGFFGPQKAREAGPGIGVDSTSLAEQAIEAPLAFIDETARNLSQANFAAGKFLMNLGETIFKRGDQSFGTKYDQISTLGNLIRRQPTIEGTDPSEVTDTINRLADAYLGENPDASGADLAKAVSEGVYNQYEAGYALAAADADLVINEEARDKAIQDAEEAKQQEEALATDDSVSGTEVPDPAPERPDQDSQTVLDGVITGSKAVQDIQSGVEKETALAAEDALGADLANLTIPEAADKDEKTTEELLEMYKTEFLNSVGEYEGKTEGEIANDWIKMGMAIAAGQSQYAISNIANGVLKTIDAFGDDPRSKRAYNNKVKLAAAKYSLESLAKYRSNLEQTSRDDRALFNTRFRVQPGESFEYNGRTYNAGDTVIAQVGDIRSGVFPLNKVNSEAFDIKLLEDQVRDLKKTLKSNLSALGDRTEKGSSIDSAVEAYGNQVAQVRANIGIQHLLKEAMTMTGAVTGGANALLAFGQKVENFLGIKLGEFSAEEPEKYRFLVNQAIQKNITALLNEGNRTISDADRARAETIGGLYADYVLAPSTMNRDILENTLIEFSNSIKRNTQETLADMQARENTWAGTLTKGGRDAQQIMEQRRGTLALETLDPSSGKRVPSKIKWTDILDVKGEGKDRTITYKSDWFKRPELKTVEDSALPENYTKAKTPEQRLAEILEENRKKEGKE